VIGGDAPEMAVAFEVVDPRHPDAQEALVHYLAEVASNISDPVVGTDDRDEVDDFTAPSGAFVVVRDDGLVIGCGAVRSLSADVGEIKRMWIHPSRRGAGLGGRLLTELENLCGALGYGIVRLDTNDALAPAIGLYESRGYRRIDRYNDNPDATHFYERELR